MNVMFLGDIVGKCGRQAVVSMLPSLVHEHALDFVIANAENAAGGKGITAPIISELRDAGVDVITLGNHAFAKECSHDWFASEPRVIRPANFPPGVPGRGSGLYRTKSGVIVGVINLIGRVHMGAADCPFDACERAVASFANQAHFIIVDMHAEVTSEKAAIAWNFDGVVGAVLGTHTHVQTSDARLLPKGTAFITDVGMCGAGSSILGQDVGMSITRLRNGFGPPAILADDDPVVSGALLSFDPVTGVCNKIRSFCWRFPS